MSSKGPSFGPKSRHLSINATDPEPHRLISVHHFEPFCLFDGVFALHYLSPDCALLIRGYSHLTLTGLVLCNAEHRMKEHKYGMRRREFFLIEWTDPPLFLKQYFVMSSKGQSFGPKPRHLLVFRWCFRIGLFNTIADPFTHPWISKITLRVLSLHCPLSRGDKRRRKHEVRFDKRGVCSTISIRQLSTH